MWHNESHMICLTLAAKCQLKKSDYSTFHYSSVFFFFFFFLINKFPYRSDNGTFSGFVPYVMVPKSAGNRDHWTGGLACLESRKRVRSISFGGIKSFYIINYIISLKTYCYFLSMVIRQNKANDELVIHLLLCENNHDYVIE